AVGEVEGARDEAAFVGDHDEACGVEEGEAGETAEIGAIACELDAALEDEAVDGLVDLGALEAGDGGGGDCDRFGRGGLGGGEGGGEQHAEEDAEAQGTPHPTFRLLRKPTFSLKGRRGAVAAHRQKLRLCNASPRLPWRETARG